MKHITRTIYAALFALIGLAACTPNSSDTAGILIEGKATDIKADSLYLYDVLNEKYQYVDPIASFPIVDGKFTYHNDSIAAQLYYISTDAQAAASGSLDGSGAFVFLANGINLLTITHNEAGALIVEALDSPIAAQYKSFKEQEYTVGNRALLDSLDAAFYAARDAGDTLEMKRIKDESGPYYDEGAAKLETWMKELRAQSKYGLFDLYLFYTEDFQMRSYDSLEDINAVRESLKKYDAEAQASAYPRLIEKALAQQELSAIGVVAPEVIGENTEGATVKLSDYRGKYVLMDFWSSGCSWCRAETPGLKKVYQDFKDKDFVLLGISSDYKKEDWLGAIKEDGADWQHMLLGREGHDKTFADYSIFGIPQFILIDKEGKILAKGMRGEDIYTTVAKYLAN